LDCPWLYRRKKAEGKVGFLAELHELLNRLETGEDGGDPFNI
jgi:hypothetical protein